MSHAAGEAEPTGTGTGAQAGTAAAASGRQVVLLRRAKTPLSGPAFPSLAPSKLLVGRLLLAQNGGALIRLRH